MLGYSDLSTGFAFVPLTAMVFTASQVSARWLVELVGPRRLMIVGHDASRRSGMLWLTQLGEHSGYLSLVGPLLVFGLGNGLAFVPLTTRRARGRRARRTPARRPGWSTSCSSSAVRSVSPCW